MRVPQPSVQYGYVDKCPTFMCEDECEVTYSCSGTNGDSQLKQPPRVSQEALTDVSMNPIFVSVTLFVFFTTIFILCYPSEITACSVYLHLGPATNFLGTICSCLSWMQGMPGTVSLRVCFSVLSVQGSEHNHPATGAGESSVKT